MAKPSRKITVAVDDTRHDVGTVRTTVVMPVSTDTNLELCRIKLRLAKGALIVQAINEFLERNGFNPNETPRELNVSY